MLYKANNRLNTKDLYNFRKSYLENAYPKGQTYEIPINLWNEIPMYGKINTKNIPVFVKTSKLLPIDNQLLLDFVRDAAQDFLNACKSFVNAGKTCISTIIPSFTVKRGYIDFFTEHQRIQNNYKNILFDYIKSNHKQNEIITLKDYLDEFFSYYEDYSKISSISAHSVFVVKNSSYQTGLSFDISTLPHDDDFIKSQLFLTNPSFNDYTRIAGSYGFYVNKNAPWNLIANIGSKQMQQYMKKRGVSSIESLFESHFSPTVFEYDFQSLINLLNSSFREFIERFPDLEIKEKCSSQRFYVSRYQNSSLIVDDNDVLDNGTQLDAYLRMKLADVSKSKEIDKAKSLVIGKNKKIKEINQLIGAL